MLDPVVVNIKDDLSKLMPRQKLIAVKHTWLVLQLEDSVLDERYNIIRDFPRMLGLPSRVVIVLHYFTFFNSHHLLFEGVVEVF